jgi:hypothetical protein
MLCVAVLGLMPGVSFGWVKFYESEHRIEAKPEQTQVEVEYRFANKGDKPVKILSTETSCGCTTPKLEKDTYAPGERGRLKVVFDFEGRDGWQQKTITVKTDDPQTPVKVLKLDVNIPRIALVGPKVLQWSTDKKSGPRLLHFAGKPGLNIKVTELDYDAAALMVKEIPSEKEGEHIWAVVPKDETKAIESTIRIKTDYPAAAPKEYAIQVKVNTPEPKDEIKATAPTEGAVKEQPVDTADAKKEKPLSPMAKWIRNVYSGSDELPLRLDRHMIMFAPNDDHQTRYMSGVILSEQPIEIQKLEIKGLPECKAELVDLGWKGYFLIKFTLDTIDAKESKNQAAHPDTSDSKSEASPEIPDAALVEEVEQPAKPGGSPKPKSQRGQIFIYTNPPAPTPFPVYGFVIKPSNRRPEMAPATGNKPGAVIPNPTLPNPQSPVTPTQP